VDVVAALHEEALHGRTDLWIDVGLRQRKQHGFGRDHARQWLLRGGRNFNRNCSAFGITGIGRATLF
jgi:hypothetical protein